MKTLAVPPVDARQAYTSISATRRPPARRARLLAASESVFAVYARYAGTPDNLVALQAAQTPPATPDDLESNYASRSKAARMLKGAIFGHNRGGRCCLCGQAPAATLDHYLPKSEYPVFSILPPNLIPACWRCNHAKGGLFIEAEAALFIHGYFDTLPTDVRFLYADIDDEDGELTVAFRVDPPAAIGAALAARIQSHFRKLDLADYYLGEAINEVSERRAAIAELVNAGAPASELRDYFKREARSVAADKGINYWRFAVLDGLAECQPLLEGEII